MKWDSSIFDSKSHFCTLAHQYMNRFCSGNLHSAATALTHHIRALFPVAIYILLQRPRCGNFQHNGDVCSGASSNKHNSPPLKDPIAAMREIPVCCNYTCILHSRLLFSVIDVGVKHSGARSGTILVGWKRTCK